MPRYEEDSIVEALCEFSFAAGCAWDPTVFGRFREAITDAELPVREAGEIVEFALEPAEGGLRARRQARMRFFNQDRTRLAQVGEDLLVANVLRPYPHWEVFRPFILRTLAAYTEAANPEAIEKITLRYIDRITLPEADTVLGNWIQTKSAYVPGFLEDAKRGGFSRVEKPVVDGTEALTLVLDTDDENHRVLSIDTELVCAQVPPQKEALGTKLDKLHDRMIGIFETCITPRTRELLKPMQEAS